MCNIAGYTGSRRAAPILLEMLRHQQYMDGGYSAGIATIHEGKIYTVKILGDVDDLIRQTEAMDFPGTYGIAHTRPIGTRVSHAHPFLDRDEKLALVLNGTLRDVDGEAFRTVSNAIMQDFFDRGFPLRTLVPAESPYTLKNGLFYHDTEPYAMMMGEKIADGASPAEALAQSLSALPADIVTMAIHTDHPGEVYSGRITRPTAVAVGDGETFLSTSEIAFPEDVPILHRTYTPCASVCVATPGGFSLTPAKLTNVRVEEITPALHMEAYRRMEEMFLKTDRPLSVYDFPFYEEWRDLWQQPHTDCIYDNGKGLLKPYGDLCYRVLGDFYREGHGF